MNPSTVAYSEILQSFIEPICSEEETEKTFFKKCEVGQTVWNYCIACEFNLTIKNDLHIAITESNRLHPEMKKVVDYLTERKRLLFDTHKNFIVHIKKNNRPGGATLYAESIPADKMKNLLAKIKLPKK